MADDLRNIMIDDARRAFSEPLVEDISFADAHTLIIGDSRTVGGADAIKVSTYKTSSREKWDNAVDNIDDNGNYWYAKVGEGKSWFDGEIAKGNIAKRAQSVSNIVVALGVNDILPYRAGQGIRIAKEYAKRLNELAAGEWKGKKVYFSAVCPVAAPYSNWQKCNAEIEAFNKYMRENLKGVQFIDANKELQQQGIKYMRDGLHYQPATNKNFVAFINREVNGIVEPVRTVSRNHGRDGR